MKITEGDEPRIILHKHRKLKMLLQFGGHVELDETPWQAVLREIAEESGYDKNQLKLLQPCYNRLTSLPGVNYILSRLQFIHILLAADIITPT